MKSLKLHDAAVFNLELLATRVWLKHSGPDELPDIPKFITRDRLCSVTETAANRAGWSTICVPARADLVYSDNAPYVRLALAPGVSGLDVLNSMRAITVAGHLGDYLLTEEMSHSLGRTIDLLLLKNPSLQQPFADGWLGSDGKTFPALENIFASKEDQAIQVLEAMRAILSADFTIEAGDGDEAILKFFPASFILRN